jgi:hypothetical protein
MANPTTNYSFAMPTNTDLVKDLPADFDIFGQAVDDRIKALNPETTAGDISYRASTANAKTRLAIGTAGQILAVNSGATAPEWITLAAGGKTLLSTTTLSGTSTSITSIDQTYKDLFLIGNIRTSTDTGITVRFNSNATAGDYSSYRLYMESGTTPGIADVNNGDVGQSSSATAWNTQNYMHMNIYRYAETEYKQTFSINRASLSSGTSVRAMYEHGAFNSTTAISSIQICGGTTLSGTVYLYGVK